MNTVYMQLFLCAVSTATVMFMLTLCLAEQQRATSVLLVCLHRMHSGTVLYCSFAREAEENYLTVSVSVKK